MKFTTQSETCSLYHCFFPTISTFPQGRRAVHALLWSIFAFLFCLSAGRGCYFMKIDGYLITINPFLNVSLYMYYVVCCHESYISISSYLYIVLKKHLFFFIFISRIKILGHPRLDYSVMKKLDPIPMVLFV
jgi:hypothetical protein